MMGVIKFPPAPMPNDPLGLYIYQANDIQVSYTEQYISFFK